MAQTTQTPPPQTAETTETKRAGDARLGGHVTIVKLHEGNWVWAPALPHQEGQPHPRGKAGLWVKVKPPQYEVFAPPGRVLSHTGTHSDLAWSIKEAREIEKMTEPCETPDCDICEENAETGR